MFNRKYREAILADERHKIQRDLEDEENGAINIRSIDPNPTPNSIVDVRKPASHSQKRFLKEIRENLENSGIKVSIPKRTSDLRKGEASDVIQTLLLRQRRMEVEMVAK